MNSPVDFTSATNVAPFAETRYRAREHHAHFVGQDFVAGIIDDAATVAVAVGIQGDVGFVLQDGVAAWHAASSCLRYGL